MRSAARRRLANFVRPHYEWTSMSVERLTNWFFCIHIPYSADNFLANHMEITS